MDQLNNKLHENWYSTNNDETRVICVLPKSSYLNNKINKVTKPYNCRLLISAASS